MDRQTLDDLVRLHTNLNAFHAVVAMLEGGTVYGGVGSEKAANRIIDICKKETYRLIARYDKLRANAAQPNGADHG